MATLIDGKAIAKEIRAGIKATLESHTGPAPSMVAVEIGHDEASAYYTKNQGKTAGKLGILHRIDSLPETSTIEEVGAHFSELNADPEVTGIMLQMPIPKHLDESAIRRFIDPDKDVEAVTETAAGRLVFNTHRAAPCTALAALKCLDVATEGKIEGLDVTIVGRSAIVGRPLAMLLLHRNATVTICHTRTRDMAEKCRRADVVIAAAGRADLIDKSMVREGAIVIDVGTNYVGSKVFGDVKFDEVSEVASAITPVPGGVGPVTVALLMKNVISLAGIA